MYPSFLNPSGGSRGVSVVEIAPPDPSGAASPQSTLRKDVGREVSGLAQGRVSLLALNTLILMLIAYYVWTRSVQGS